MRTTGDRFLATFDATGRALRCAADILAGAKDIGLELRAAFTPERLRYQATTSPDWL